MINIYKCKFYEIFGCYIMFTHIKKRTDAISYEPESGAECYSMKYDAHDREKTANTA